MEPQEIRDVLEVCEFFKGLGARQINDVVQLCRVRTCEGGESIFQQGDLGEEIYVIVDGRVLLERTVNLGGRTGSVTLDVLGKGRALGCWSTVLNEPHRLMSTALCQKQTRLLVFKGADLRGMMMHDKELGFKLLENFCFLLRDRIQAAYGAMERI
jgi:CRP-like cAMP-binding protein